MVDGRASLRVIVQGVSDVGSAIAVALVAEGHRVVLVDGPQPTTIRRKMAFTDAIFDGQATLDGVTATRKVITSGATQPLRGESRPIAGHARDRYVYAPVVGEFHTACQIGDRVVAAQPVAMIGDAIIRAPLAGTLRGLIRDGVPVEIGTKVIEVDPRVNGAVIMGISERPARIAAGVLRAIKNVDVLPDASRSPTTSLDLSQLSLP